MKTDCFDLNFDICDENWNTLDRLSPSNKPAVAEGLVRALFFTFKSLARMNVFQARRQHLFLIGTHNQNMALEKVVKKVKNARKVFFHTYNGANGSHLPESVFYLLGWVFFPLSLFQVLSGTEMQKRSLLRRMERLIVSGPSVYVYRMLFFFWKPLSITVSNDHNHWTRAAIKAAKLSHIPNFYIPHASTSESFPPLEADVSFLDSEIQAQRYRNNCSNIIVVGSVRLEEKIGDIVDERIKGLVVCFNDEDKTEFIFKLLENIPNDGQWRIFVKPHPADKMRHRIIEDKCLELGFDYVDPKKSVYDLRGQASIVLAGISGVHVDAIMCGMLPVTLKDWYSKDYYKLIEDKLLLVVDKVLDIFEINLEQRSSVFSRRYFLNEHLKNTQLFPSTVISQYFKKIDLKC